MKKYFKKAVTIIACSCLFFAFTGCKDDEEPVLQPETVSNLCKVGSSPELKGKQASFGFTHTNYV